MTPAPNKAQHSPLPWRTGDLYHTIFGPPNGQPCPEIIATVNRGNVKANAALIVRAVNHADKLAACLRSILNERDSEHTRQHARALLAAYEAAQQKE